MENNKCIKEKDDYLDKKRYIDFCVDKFNISEELEYTLNLSTKKQLRSFIKHIYNFDINSIDNDLDTLLKN